MKILFFISTLFMMSVSYQNNDKAGELNKSFLRPVIPDNVLIDINSDRKADFEISYREMQTCDIPSSGGSIIGSIKPLNDNQLLYRYANGYLFLNNKDTIKTKNNSNSTWSNYGADIISIDRRDYNKWDKTWSIISKSNPSNFMAFKHYEGVLWKHSTKIGWLFLEFDINTGEVIVSDFKISRLDELIIKKQ
ncbi:MAG: hypothetical protein K8R74_07845 [Bacteroidales bacterium]|nr:hypothetical protein [Bacteroidales bacterium]